VTKIKEILVYHHSHLDIGYTHPQPVLWELQKKFINQAVELCEQTENESEVGRFRWTCEATAPVVKWLESATPAEIEKFSKYVRNGQICLTATNLHTSPLSSSEQLARMFYPLNSLRERYGTKINTAINHDINGQPWSFAQIMLDAGVELYTTGINIHFGGIPLPRPLVFRWKAPDGRELLTFNGEHYSMFNQFSELWEKDLDKMQKGIKVYLDRLEKDEYPYDFVYISSTNYPMFDNTPPDPDLLEMLHRWNAAEIVPKIKMATPEMLLEKIKSIPAEEIPVYAGDWTDYWNFGAASSAFETRLSRRTRQSLKAAELLASFQGLKDESERKIYHEAWDQLNLYDEHTWGANVSISAPYSIMTKVQWMHKAHTAYQSNSLAGYLLANQLEQLADNPLQSEQPEGIIFVNPTHVPQQVDIRLPEEFTYKSRHTRANRYKFQQLNEDPDWSAPSMGTVVLPPFSWKKIPISNLSRTVRQIDITPSSIENDYFSLEFDSVTGRITGLFDKKNNWHVLNPKSNWTLFQFVNERIDPLKQPNNRVTLFPRVVEKCNNSISCWNHDWPPLRLVTEKLLECKVDRHDSGATLVLRWDAPGVDWLEQKITLFADHPRIELSASFYKKDVCEPESIYFVFPLNLMEWKSKFDSAGAIVELDHEQLPTACKDWVTVEHTVSVFDREKGVTLACPDAPLVQIGSFNFGKEQSMLPKDDAPLLLGWAANNYWDTNFRASQPGVITVKYELTSFNEFSPELALRAGIDAFNPVQMFPAIDCKDEEEGAFIEIDNPLTAVLHIKPAESKDGIILRLTNLSERSSETANVRLPNLEIVSASITDMLENDVTPIPLEANSVKVTIPARRIMTIRLSTLS